MTSTTPLTLDVETDLRSRFLAEAEAVNLPASQIVGDFMRAFVEERREARLHDAWFRNAVADGLIEADDPTAVRTSNDDVVLRWHRRRVALTAPADPM